MSVTLCTSFLNYYKTPLEPSTILLRLQRLKSLLDLKIPICVFVGVDCKMQFQNFLNQQYDDQTFIHVTNLQEHIFENSFVFREAARAETTDLPKDKSPPKDTFDYMCYLHTKIEFLKKATDMNPFSTTHFAWVDYNLSQMFQKNDTLPYDHILEWCKKIKTPKYLPATELALSETLFPHQEMYIPGCWSKISESDDFYQKVVWRFCGGFLCGSICAIQHFWTLYETHFCDFLKKGKTMVWDVNFWAWLEYNPKIDWQPIWYEADHNDSIIKLPMFAQCSPMIKNCSRIRRIAPKFLLTGYAPSAVSMVTFKNMHIMNIRYINYKYLPSGHCEPIKNNVTITKNVCVAVYARDFYVPMDVPTLVKESEMGLVSDAECPFQGFEDIRLFYHEQRVQFLASTVNYSGCNKNRMVIGDYDYIGKALRHAKIIDPPTDTNREKNWIPIVYGDELSILYGWSPNFIVGTIIDSIMVVKTEKKIKNAIFRNYEMRGSTNFVPLDGKLVGLVHFTVPGTLPRQYFHILVQIDPVTWTPISFSDPLYFDTVGIEFCIHMEIFDRKKENVFTEDPFHLGRKSDELFYAFYLSRQDRDPHQLCFSLDLFPLKNEFTFLT
jgi:hypothetical protein